LQIGNGNWPSWKMAGSLLKQEEPMSKRPYVTPEEVERMKELQAIGMTFKEIADEIGRNEQSVRKWLALAKVKQVEPESVAA
jgi:DNA-binding NarL/FixJ family response regulator